MNEITAAIVGSGAIATLCHIPNVSTSRHFDLIAVVDTIEHRAEMLANQYGIGGFYPNVDNLLAAHGSELDAVFVCTPPSTHLDVLRSLAPADPHVFMEKPIASTPWEAEQVVDTALSIDGCTMVGYQRQFDPAIEDLRLRLEAGLNPITVSARNVDPDIPSVLAARPEPEWDFSGPSPPPESVVDRLITTLGTDERSRAIGFYFKTAQIVHEVNLLRDLLGDVQSVLAAHVFEETFIRTDLLHESGTRSSLLAGVTDRDWFDQIVTIEGDTERISISFENPWIQESTSQYEVRSDSTDDVVTNYQGSYHREIVHFASCIRQGIDPRTPLRQAARDIEAIVDIYRAIN